MNRRTFLKLAGTGALLAVTGNGFAAPRRPNPERLAAAVRDVIGDREMGFALRHIAPNGSESYRITHNAARLYPTASSFKAFLALYYFWHMPPENWETDRTSDIYRVVVFSDNTQTGAILRDVGSYIPVFGNTIEKFNDFLLFTMGLTEGLHRWRWQGNPVEFDTDRRFEPSETRFVSVRGVRHNVDNLTTADDMVTGYDFMLKTAAGQPPVTPMTALSSFDPRRAQSAARAALNMLSIASANYNSPFERVGFTGYTGKDGILPFGDITAGNVVVDAGIVPAGESRLIAAFLSVGQTEFTAIQTLRQIAANIQQYGM